MKNREKVLIINGFQYGLPVADAYTMAIVDTLKAAGVTTNDIFVEYLDLNRKNSEQHRKMMHEILAEKENKVQIGLIIATDHVAANFIANEGKDLFEGVPLIISYDEEPAWAGTPRPLIVVAASNDAEGTVRNAFELFQDTENVVIIAGKDDEKAPFIERITSAIETTNRQVSIEKTNKLPYNQMLEKISYLPANTIVFYGSYFEDVAGDTFVPAAVAKIVSLSANAPVFGFVDMHIQHGLVGGSVVLHEELGKQVAHLALDIFSGALELSDKPIRLKPDFYPLYDWQQLKRWNANHSILPVETVFLNYTPTLWETHQMLIISTILFILVLFILICLLLSINKKQKTTMVKLQKAKKEQQKSWKKLMNVIEATNAGTWEFNLKTGEIEINHRWAKMVGYTFAELKPHDKEMWRKLVHPEDLKVAEKQLQLLFSGKRKYYDVEFRMRHKNGDWVWVQSKGNVMTRTSDGCPTIVSGTHSDITDRKLAEIKLLEAYDDTIKGWSYALDLKDEDTENHSKRVTELTLRIAEQIGIGKEDLIDVRRGALLHDIGKMGIPDEILLKKGKLTSEEWEIMRKHPIYAYEMLSAIDYLRPALDIPYCHHEKWDGSGYPRGLKGKQIPLAARIFAIVDVFDALTSDRPYRKAWSKERTLALIREDSGTHFDPHVVEVFLKVMENSDD